MVLETEKGEIYFKENHTGLSHHATIYEGNCDLIAIVEWKEGDDTVYAPYLFFCDEGHAKKCLGLTRDVNGEKSNLYTDIYKIRISKKHTSFKQIINWFTKAYDNIIIEIYNESEDNDGKD